MPGVLPWPSKSVGKTRPGGGTSPRSSDYDQIGASRTVPDEIFVGGSERLAGSLGESGETACLDRTSRGWLIRPLASSVRLYALSARPPRLSPRTPPALPLLDHSLPRTTPSNTRTWIHRRTKRASRPRRSHTPPWRGQVMSNASPTAYLLWAILSVLVRTITFSLLRARLTLNTLFYHICTVPRVVASLVRVLHLRPAWTVVAALRPLNPYIDTALWDDLDGLRYPLGSSSAF